MNRLIIIGNGFDLAHGLKTSYNDFIDWIFDDYKTINQILTPNESNNLLKPSLEKVKEHPSQYATYENSFFKRIHQTKKLKKWVDIENEYYKLLLEYTTQEKLIQKLNAEFEEIKKLLEEYLTEQVEKYKGNEIDLNYDELFFPNESKTKSQGHLPRKSFVHILNFNYTNTPHFYLEKFKKENPNNSLECTITNIHGELNNKDNPIIFGYGDEKHIQFEDILHNGNNDLLRNVKHYKYLQNHNLTYLESFFTKKPAGSMMLQNFEVLIFGHSCGNSDRTLFNMIFEKPELTNKGIRIFLRDKVDKEEQRLKYEDLIIQISRTLNNSGNVRDKVQIFQKSHVMPSFQKETNS